MGACCHAVRLRNEVPVEKGGDFVAAKSMDNHILDRENTAVCGVLQFTRAHLQAGSLLTENSRDREIQE